MAFQPECSTKCHRCARPLPHQMPRFLKLEGGVKVQVLSEGSGPEAAPGDRLLVDYVLRRGWVGAARRVIAGRNGKGSERERSLAALLGGARMDPTARARGCSVADLRGSWASKAAWVAGLMSRPRTSAGRHWQKLCPHVPRFPPRSLKQERLLHLLHGGLGRSAQRPQGLWLQ